jgi:hypothetical protein
VLCIIYYLYTIYIYIYLYIFGVNMVKTTYTHTHTTPHLHLLSHSPTLQRLTFRAIFIEIPSRGLGESERLLQMRRLSPDDLLYE